MGAMSTACGGTRSSRSCWHPPGTTASSRSGRSRMRLRDRNIVDWFAFHLYSFVTRGLVLRCFNVCPTEESHALAGCESPSRVRESSGVLLGLGYPWDLKGPGSRVPPST
jgi:hypothetical protein